MRIAIIGTGPVGSVLGVRWAQNGHQLVWGSRTPDSQRVQQLVKKAGDNAVATTPKEAVVGAAVVVLATRHDAFADVLGQLGDLSGKIIIDPNNPLNEMHSNVRVGATTSISEMIADLIPNVPVVKAFNMTGATYNMAAPIYGEQKLSMFICGDDEEAKLTVAGLVEELDFDVVDCGALTAALYLESMALLWITLARKMGPNIGFRLLTR